MSHLSGFPATVIYRELQSRWARNTLKMPINSVKLAMAPEFLRDTMLSWAWAALFHRLRWIEGFPTSYLDFVVTSYRSQVPCLQVIVLWEDKRKRCCFHLTTSAAAADPLIKRRGCRFRLFGSPNLVSLTELSSNNVENTCIHNWSLQPFSQDYWPSFSYHLCCVC